MKLHLSTRATLWVFLFLVVFVIGQGTWWIVFMAQLTDEKVDIATELGAGPEYVTQIHEQEVARQIMIGTEGVVFLLLLCGGTWLIYNAHRRTQRLREQQQNFLMAVTHELKTPLASMKLYLDTLKSPKISDDRKLEVLPRMRDDVVRLEGIVEDILEAGRFERHTHKLDLARVDLSSIVRAAVETIRKQPTDLEFNLHEDIDPVVAVYGDAVVLGRAVLAVLDNAMKYHDDSRIDITVTLKPGHNRAVLTIQDRGIGLERGETEAIFERFYRVGNEMTRQTEGSGLGLYLCREMIKAHKGTISVHSDGLGQGTRFEITLPLSN